MRLPVFTAKASLGRTAGNYYTAATGRTQPLAVMQLYRAIDYPCGPPVLGRVHREKRDGFDTQEDPCWVDRHVVCPHRRDRRFFGNCYSVCQDSRDAAPPPPPPTCAEQRQMCPGV